MKLGAGLLKHLGLLTASVSIVLGVFLYDVETWAPTQKLLDKLDQFYWRCVCCILGISKTVPLKEHLTTAELAGWFGMVESIVDLLT